VSWNPQGQPGPQAPSQSQQPHPTVPYGQNEPPPQMPQQMQQPPQRPQPQPPQPYQPPQGPPQGYNVNAPPTIGGQPMQVPQQQEPGQAQLTVDPNSVLDGPNVPPELRGRRFGQVMQIYSALAQDWLQRSQHQTSGGSLPSQSAAPEPQGQRVPQQGQQPQPQPNRPQPQGQADWRDEIRGIVREVVAPVVQSNQANQIQQARDMARMAVPDFTDLEPDLMHMLAQAPPESLTNPQVWETAADMIRGRKARMGYGQMPPQQGQVGQQPSALRPSVPAGQTVIPHHTFFTEGPSAPVLSPTSGSLSPQERLYAQKMGMSDHEYMAWRGGVVR
jgi:hypothetical protein